MDHKNHDRVPLSGGDHAIVEKDGTTSVHSQYFPLNVPLFGSSSVVSEMTRYTLRVLISFLVAEHVVGGIDSRQFGT